MPAGKTKSARAKSNCIKDSVYIDDGYSGSDFRRPGFREMMEDVGQGKANLVIVKDLSRFGREYIETGRYLQKIFPALGVRFIAVTDHYDSLTADGMGKNLLLPVKNFINDAYSADLSVKIKSHLESRRANGDYTGAYVSYGFLKDTGTPGRLLPDPEAGEVVRQIFCWKIDGMSNRQIADRLNALGILSPAEYKRNAGIRYQSGFQKKLYSLWSPAAVGRILTNPLCRGLVVQGKRERINHKIKKMVERPPEERSVFFQESLALMGEGQFETMQCLLKKDIRAKPGGGGVFPFSGMLQCPDCGRQLIRRQNVYKNKKTAFYICKTYNVEKGCTRHSVREEVPNAIIGGFLGIWAENILGTEGREGAGSLAGDLSWEKLGRLPALGREGTDWLWGNGAVLLEHGRSRELEKELSGSREMLSGLLGDWQEGILTEEEYEEMKSFYEGRCRLLQEQLRERDRAWREGSLRPAAEETSQARAKENHKEAGQKGQKAPEKGMGCEGQPSRSFLAIFLDRIWIYEDKRIELAFRCREPYF